MYTFDGRSKESMENELTKIDNDIKKTLKEMTCVENDSEINNESGSIKSNSYFNNDILLRTKLNRRKNGKRKLVNKHFLTESDSKEKINEEDLKKMLDDTDIIVDLSSNSIM